MPIRLSAWCTLIWLNPVLFTVYPFPLLKNKEDSQLVLPLNPETYNNAKPVRCGRSATRSKRYVAYNKRWLYSDLTWKLVDPFSMFEKHEDFQVVRDVISEAVRLWVQAANGVLEMDDWTKSTENADIEIFFATGAHGDHEPFDGIGGIVAHTGYPMQGKLHFDGAELWTLRQDRGVDLRYVALHELGHALGLRHSQQNDSIMYPIYKRSTDELGLAQDDINGVRQLFQKPIKRRDLQRDYQRRSIAHRKNHRSMRAKSSRHNAL